MTKTHWIIAAIAAALMFLLGFLTGKAVYDRPITEKVERDTIVITDTIPQYFPQPVEVEKVRTEYKWLTRIQPVGKTDTLLMRDSVLVEVPIESKHYHATEYDAWVSGYEPSLDSIKVYQRTEYITETVTLSKPPNRFTVGIQGGYGYGFKSKQWEPYVGIGIGIRIF